jgi:hypothetical protein
MITVNQLCNQTLINDGTPYMGMTGIENTAPKNEVIVLTAIDVDSLQMLKVTYIGDKLAYDFNDNKIVDENGTFITSRNGFVLRRINLEIQLILIGGESKI